MISWSEKSVTGRRSENHDSCMVRQLRDNVFFLGVSDGLGCEQSGKLASSLVLESAYSFLDRHWEGLFPPIDPAGFLSIFSKMFFKAHVRLAEALDSNPANAGMASTLCVGIISGDSLYVGKLGNSRAYLLRDNTLFRISSSWSLLAVPDTPDNPDQWPAGDSDGFQNDPPGRYISMYPGENRDDAGPVETESDQDVHSWAESMADSRLVDGNMQPPEVYPANGSNIRLLSNDVLLFCSDGLLNGQPDLLPDFIRKVLARHRTNPEKAAEELINHALDLGADDNISVIVASFRTQPKSRIASLFF